MSRPASEAAGLYDQIIRQNCRTLKTPFEVPKNVSGEPWQICRALTHQTRRRSLAVPSFVYATKS